MKSTLTIGELAKQTGVPTKTIRFYESIGLIGEPERLDNGYRVYPQMRIEELALIKSVRDLGLPIPQIKRLMIGCEDGDCSHSQEYIDKEITDYVDVLSKKIAEMSNLKEQLLTLKKNVDICSGDHDSPYCCNVLGQIANQSKGGEEI
jgi:MerR family transcriptional regulator, copper efflux regulator